MSAAAQQTLIAWAEATFPLGETLGVGGLLADGTSFHHGATAEYAACMDPAVWTALASALTQLAASDCDGERSVWVFEGALLWTARRPDGACLGVFTARDLSQEARDSIMSRVAQFVTLA